MTREEAIEEFESELRWAELNTYPYVSKQKIEANKMAIKALEQETKQGHWIKLELNPNYECSECHRWNNKETNYCPNCGAKMEAE